MPAIVQIPRVVQDARDEFADLFANEPQRQHFAEYLTGLMVAHNKTVSGISSEFAETTDQSCLNRFLTEVDWDVEELNERRLQLHQDDADTRYYDQGVIAIDDVTWAIWKGRAWSSPAPPRPALTATIWTTTFRSSTRPTSATTRP